MQEIGQGVNPCPLLYSLNAIFNVSVSVIVTGAQAHNEVVALFLDNVHRMLSAFHPREHGNSDESDNDNGDEEFLHTSIVGPATLIAYPPFGGIVKSTDDGHGPSELFHMDDARDRGGCQASPVLIKGTERMSFD